jgi:DNA repair exonuclease SbcCD ATPase subunit
MNEARHARHRKKIDKQKLLDQIEERAKTIAKTLIEIIKEKARLIVNDLNQVKHAKHRKRVDKEKVEKVAERVIIKTALMFAIVFIPLFIVGFVFFEFGGLIKDAFEFIVGIAQKIGNILHHIIGFIQQVIAAFKQLKG